LLEAYEQQIFSSKDRAIYASLIEHRRDYLKTREATINLINAGQMQAAASQCQNQSLPAFMAYKEQADKLFEFNMKASKSRGEASMRVCTGTQILVAIV